MWEDFSFQAQIKQSSVSHVGAASSVEGGGAFEGPAVETGSEAAESRSPGASAMMMWYRCRSGVAGVYLADVLMLSCW